MRQIVDVIRERMSMEDTKQRTYIEWQTRALASFMAANAQSEKGAKKMQEAAEKLSILPQDGSEQQSRRQAPPTTEHLEHPERVQAPQGKQGSFEKLSGIFGGASGQG